MNELDIARGFRTGSEPVAVKRVTCGNINRTYKISFADGSNCIMQSINTSVFKNPFTLMANIDGVCRHQREKLPDGGPLRETITFVPSSDGTNLYVDADGAYWRMYRFIDAVSYQSPEKPGLFYQAAKAFGHFQQLLSDYPMETLSETIPNFHNTVKRFSDFTEAVERRTIPERYTEAEALIEQLLDREPLAHVAVDALHAGETPLRVTHNDTKLNNILMDATTDEGICVIDLDTVMPGSVLYDFGDAIRFGASTAPEDEPDTVKIALNLSLFEEFVRGFIAGTNGSLTKQELSLLPEGAMLLTYEQAMRFLGDYLNGDTYFKINSEKHNLIRARAQVALLLDMEKKRSEMKRIIADYT